MVSAKKGNQGWGYVCGGFFFFSGRWHTLLRRWDSCSSKREKRSEQRKPERQSSEAAGSWEYLRDAGKPVCLESVNRAENGLSSDQESLVGSYRYFAFYPEDRESHWTVLSILPLFHQNHFGSSKQTMAGPREKPRDLVWGEVITVLESRGKSGQKPGGSRK